MATPPSEQPRSATPPTGEYRTQNKLLVAFLGLYEACEAAGLVRVIEQGGIRYVELPTNPPATPDAAAGVLSPPSSPDSKVDPGPAESATTPRKRKSTASKSPKRAPVSGGRYQPEFTVLPIVLDTPAFREVWGEWCAHRNEIAQKLTPTSVRNQLMALARWGESRATAAIRFSIVKGWRGIYEDDKAKQIANVGAQDQRVTDGFLGTDGQWNDRHTPEEIAAIMDQPDVPEFPFVNTPKKPPEQDEG